VETLDSPDCIRCDEALAVDNLGYCAHCHWAVKAEVVDGLYALMEYLEPHLRFSDWCLEHPTVPTARRAYPGAPAPRPSL
jgi:hypothetical protein